MKLNFKSAMLSLTQDPLWKIKLSIGTILCLINGLNNHYINNLQHMHGAENTGVKIVFYLFTFLIGVFVSGFYYKYLHNLLVESDEILPCWKDSKFIFNTGLKAIAGGLVLMVPFVLLKLFIVFLQNLTNIAPHGITIFATLFLVLCLFVGTATFILLYVPFIYLMAVVFAFDLKFSSFFNFKKGMNLIKSHACSFYFLIFIYAIFTTLQALAFYLFKFDLIAMILFTLPSFYLSLVWFNLIAQWTKREPQP